MKEKQNTTITIINNKESGKNKNNKIDRKNSDTDNKHNINNKATMTTSGKTNK